MAEFNFKPGDLVRVKEPEALKAEYAKKLIDRDGVIVWVGPIAPHEMWPRHANVKFLKRGARGKEFTMIILKSELIASPNQIREPA